jgi:hypothetical protein
MSASMRGLTRQASISEPAAISSGGSSLGVIFASHKSTFGNFKDSLSHRSTGLEELPMCEHGSIP